MGWISGGEECIPWLDLPDRIFTENTDTRNFMWQYWIHFFFFF